MESLKELYRIGPGPSSSHTLAVRNACLLYLDKYPNYSKYYVTLCGSLALTGKGHMSDKIIEKVFGPQNVEISFQRQMYMDKPNVLIFHTDNNENEMIIISTGGGAIEVVGQESLVDNNVYPHNSLKEIKQYCSENNLRFVDYVYQCEKDIKPY